MRGVEDSCWGQVDYEDKTINDFSSPEYKEIQKLHIRFMNILDRIEYKREEWRKVLKYDGRFFFQFEWDDKCNYSGKYMLSRSAKYYLSEHMTETEVVNRVFLAALKGEEHEAREKFRYCPEGKSEFRAPYNTHIDVNKLWSIGDKFDAR